MIDRLYVARGDRTAGPFSAAQLRGLASAGRIRPTDAVWREGAIDKVGGRREGEKPVSVSPDPGAGEGADALRACEPSPADGCRPRVPPPRPRRIRRPRRSNRPGIRAKSAQNRWPSKPPPSPPPPLLYSKPSPRLPRPSNPDGEAKAPRPPPQPAQEAAGGRAEGGRHPEPGRCGPCSTEKSVRSAASRTAAEAACVLATG